MEGAVPSTSSFIYGKLAAGDAIVDVNDDAVTVNGFGNSRTCNLAFLIEKHVLRLAKRALDPAAGPFTKKLTVQLTVARQKEMAVPLETCRAVKKKRIEHVQRMVADVRLQETQAFVSRLEEVASQAVFQKAKAWKDQSRLPPEMIQEAIVLAFELQSTPKAEWSWPKLVQWQCWWSCCPPLQAIAVQCLVAQAAAPVAAAAEGQARLDKLRADSEKYLQHSPELRKALEALEALEGAVRLKKASVSESFLSSPPQRT